MNYITTVQAAEKWGITTNRITVLAKGGRIPGARQLGLRWMIPETAEKPADGRKKQTKVLRQDESYFRYPNYTGREPSSVFPPLSEEELQLKLSMEAFHACRFEESESLLGDLYVRSTNRYHRITSLRIACMNSIFLYRSRTFINCYEKLTIELEEDCPHKPEMRDMLHELDATLWDNQYFQDEFQIEPIYVYHESFLPQLTALNALSLFYSADKNISPNLLRSCELSCALIDSTEHYVEAQTTHLYLGCTCSILGMQERAEFHLRKALQLAEKHDLFYGVAIQYNYMKDAFQSILEDFPAAFRSRLLRIAEDIHTRYVNFTDLMSIHTVYKYMQGNDYLLILY